ncbi:MAG: M48 family metalloprotease [Deltaproteobacteria bacterium]|nr:M48 family metalloprotease [Deltaproteobacteria bacterium]
MKVFTKIIPVCMLVMVFFLLPSLCDAFWKKKSPVDSGLEKRISRNLIGQKIQIIPPLNKFNFGFGRHKGIEYQFNKSLSPIFFQDETIVAEVEEMGFKGSVVWLNLYNPIHGHGKITYFFRKNHIKNTPPEKIREILLTPLTSENNLYVFGNKVSKMYHLFTSNHLPSAENTHRMKPQDAEKEGYRKCAFCFSKTLYVPDFPLETALAREWSARLGGLGPFLVGTDADIQLDKMGRTVLNNWPFPLMGYEYSFDLIQSDHVGAYAIPAGKVVVTTAFLESLEHDEEIEAMLIRAVAHIERRHALRQFLERTKDIEMEKLSKGIAVAAGAVASLFAGPMFEVLGVAGILPSQVAPVRLLGYHPDFESEADILAALYFDAMGKDRDILCGFLKKMQFHEMTQQMHPDNEEVETPSIGEKTYQACHEKFKYFGMDGDFVIQNEGRNMARLRLLFQGIFQGQNELTLYVDNRKFVEIHENTRDNTVISLSVADKNGNHGFSFVPGTMLPDAWGIFLSFKRTKKNAPDLLEAVSSVTLSLKFVTESEGMEELAQTSHFRFVPGGVQKTTH